MTTAPLDNSDEFNINDILKEAAATTVSADPKDVSKTALALIGELDDPDWQDATRQLLDLYSPHYIARTRPTHRARKTRTTTKKGKSAKRKPTGSRLAALTRRVDSWLDSREYIAPRDLWIRLGDASLDDLADLRDDRYQRAEQLTAKGDWFNTCIESCTEHGVATLRELRTVSEASVLELMGVTITDDSDPDGEES